MTFIIFRQYLAGLFRKNCCSEKLKYAFFNLPKLLYFPTAVQPAQLVLRAVQRIVPQFSGRARTARRDRHVRSPSGGRHRTHAPVPLHRPPLLATAPSVQPFPHHGAEAPSGGEQEGGGLTFFLIDYVKLV